MGRGLAICPLSQTQRPGIRYVEDEDARLIMDFLHYEFDAGPKETVEVTLDKQANVRMLDGENYESYREGRSYSYVGGLATASPYRLQPPHRAKWHIVVDLGGRTGTIQASVVLRS